MRDLTALLYNFIRHISGKIKISVVDRDIFATLVVMIMTDLRDLYSSWYQQRSGLLKNSPPPLHLLVLIIDYATLACFDVHNLGQDIRAR